MGTVLCTDGLTSKSLAITRSLGSKGIKVVTADKTYWHTSGFSKYSSVSLTYPDPKKSPERFVSWLKATLLAQNIDVLFLLDDDTLQAAMPYREELAGLCRLALPPEEGYAIASDKGRVMEMAMQLGTPCPKTVRPNFPERWSKEELQALTVSMSFPLIVKPRFSSGSRGIRKVENEEDLLATFAEIHAQYPNPLIQEYIPDGPKFDVCVCYGPQQSLVGVFVQQEIRNFPIPRGPSTVHESQAYPELIASSMMLMDRLNWYSVADIEFMVDPRDGVPKLMEINPRFWSSLHLSIRCGIDFPWMCYCLAMDQDIEPQVSYVRGLQGKSLLPGDLLHFLTNPHRRKMDPPFWNKLPDDILSREDPWPTIGFLLSALRYSLKPRWVWNFLIRR